MWFLPIFKEPMPSSNSRLICKVYSQKLFSISCSFLMCALCYLPMMPECFILTLTKFYILFLPPMYLFSFRCQLILNSSRNYPFPLNRYFFTLSSQYLPLWCKMSLHHRLEKRSPGLIRMFTKDRLKRSHFFVIMSSL